MTASFRTFILAAIVLTLVALPSVALAAGGQPVTAAVATVFGAAVDNDLSHKPPPCPPPCPPPHYPPAHYPPAHYPPPCPPPYHRAAPPPAHVYYYPAPTPTPAPSTPVGANIGTYQITKVVGDRQSSTLYAYTDDDWLFRSDEDGHGWYLITTDPAVDDFVMSPSDPSVLYSGAGPDCGGSAATIAPMYKSEDGGETWTELPGGLGLKPMLIDPSNADNLFAADCTTLYLSTDGGETWSPKPAAAADNIWQTYTPADMSSGAQWDQLFAVGNDVQDVGVVASTSDQGASWANITNPEDAPQKASVVLASLNVGGTLWVVTSQGVWSTPDYGVNWSLSKTGLEYLIKTHTVFNDLAYGYNGSLYLATEKGLYVQSAPDGVWRLPDDDDVDFGPDVMKSLLVTESNPTRLWINALDKDDDPIVYTMAVK